MEVSNINQGVQTASYESGVSEKKVIPISINGGQSNFSDSKTQAQDRPMNEKDLEKAVGRLNKFVETDNITVEYDIHPQFKDIMVKIIDKKTGDVITEVPPKKILDMVAKMCELAGVIFDRKA